MIYILDTNVLIHMVRNSLTWQYIDKQFELYKADNKVFISIVSEAEMYSLAMQLQWGTEKIKKLDVIMSSLTALYINKSVVKAYIEIDTYSQAKNKNFTASAHFTARNMGKNDIWIAATTVVAAGELITTDKDFTHLDNVFFKVHCIEI